MSFTSQHYNLIHQIPFPYVAGMAGGRRENKKLRLSSIHIQMSDFFLFMVRTQLAGETTKFFLFGVLTVNEFYMFNVK